jgi:hypothetical protein
MAVRKIISIASARFSEETSPVIDPLEPEAIEHFLKENGPCRRLALVFLSRLWSSTVASMRADREFAAAAAEMLRALEQSKECYRGLAEYMDSAAERLRAALDQHPDGEQLIAEAERNAYRPEVLQ